MKIETIAVVGAGQMGAGIAQVCAQSGFNTTLWDANGAALDKGMDFIHKQLNRLVEKEKISSSEAAAAQKNLARAADISALSGSQLVIEAIIEKADPKIELFKKLDQLLAPESILASNTSSISITRLAAATTRPEKFIGMHFMNPVPVMKLVEIIRGLQCSDATFQSVHSVCEQMGKTTVLGIDSPGFIVNRILCPMINEAIFLLQEGVKPEDIDSAMKLGTNQPMGPLTLADYVGLDTLLSILQILHNELGEDKYRPAPLLIKYVEAGWYGKKDGRGFYVYQ